MIRPEILCRHRTERYIKDKTSFERRFYISSLPAHAERLARSVRAHWTVENRLHWCMDVAFADDRMRARTGHAAHNLALLKHITSISFASTPSSKRAASRRDVLSLRLPTTIAPNFWVLYRIHAIALGSATFFL